jgi:hypothetical protein
MPDARSRTLNTYHLNRNYGRRSSPVRFRCSHSCKTKPIWPARPENSKSEARSPKQTQNPNAPNGLRPCGQKTKQTQSAWPGAAIGDWRLRIGDSRTPDGRPACGQHVKQTQSPHTSWPRRCANTTRPVWRPQNEANRLGLGRDWGLGIADWGFENPRCARPV